MPGHNDPNNPGADFLAHFLLHRTISADDADLNFADVINFKGSQTATRNKLHIYLKRTAGTGTLKIEFYFKPDAGALANIDVKDFEEINMEPGQVYRFDAMLAYAYKLKATRSDAAAVFEIYISTSY